MTPIRDIFMEQVIICDIDGVLANPAHRLHFIKPPAGAIHFKKEELDWEPDWDAFHAACSDDEPYRETCRLLMSIIQHSWFRVIFVTGRPELIRNKTLDWLLEHLQVSYDEFKTCCDLYMRPNGDHRNDDELKKEIYEKHIKGIYSVQGVFEDRNRVVRMWRGLGLQVYQTRPGEF